MLKVGKFLWTGLLAAPLLGLAGLMPAPAQAQWETAFIAVEQSRGLPVRGESRNSVRRKFGEPAGSRGPVGRPPISTWVYPDFTVYFEYDLVITSVAAKDALPNRLGDIQ